MDAAGQMSVAGLGFAEVADHAHQDHARHEHSRQPDRASVTSQITDAVWLALSDHAGPVSAGGMDDIVQSGSFVLDLKAPADGGTVLLDYRADQGWARAFSIFYDASVGIVLLHRQGATVQRHSLPGPVPGGWDLARLTFGWDGPARNWTLQLADAKGRWVIRSTGSNPMAMAGDDIVAMCAGPNAARRDPVVQWFGFSRSAPLLPQSTWVGHRTPIETHRGPVAAGDLRPDDRIMTREQEHCALHALHRMTLPNRGRFAPVLLRAPYFGRQTDLLVAPRTLLLLAGTSVEYLFGEEAVLAAAATLCDGNTALPDDRRPVTTCVALDLGTPAVIIADDCPLLCGSDTPDQALPHRLLRGYEVRPLQALLGSGGHRSAA